MAISEALNAGAVYSEMILRMEKFDAAMASIQSALKKIDSETAKTKSKLAGMADGMDAVGKKMSMAFTLPFSVMSFAAIGSALGDSVKNASDLNETVSKTSVIFGNSSRDIMEWSDTAAGSLGMSKRVALDSASSFALFAKQAGLSGQAVNDFSKQNVKMAADLASFFNSSPEEAITAISAALRGESEPIRRYNVLLDDASLRQEALKKGLISTTKDALTPQQRILAAQSLIMQQASAASGDFARTSDQLANQQRIQAAEYENVSAKLGASLLPIMLSFKSTLVDVLKWISDLSDGQKKAIVYIGAVAVAIGPVLVVLAKVISATSAAIGVVSGLRAAMTGAALATNASKASLLGYTVATKAATIAKAAFNAVCALNPFVLIGAAAVGAAAAIAVVTKRLIESRDEAKKLQDTIDTIKNTKLDFATSAAADQQFKDIMKNVQKMKDSGKSVAEITAQLTLWHDKALAKYNAVADKSSQAAQYQLNWANATKKAMQEIAGNKLNSDDQSAKDKRQADIEKWQADQKKFRDAMSEYMKKAGRDDLELEEIRYRDDVQKYKDALAQKFISEKEYWDAIDKLNADHLKNKEKINGNFNQAFVDAWKGAMSATSSNFIDQIDKINNLSEGLADDTQKTQMKVATTISAAFSAVGNIISSIFSYQQQMIEKQYSHATAAETAYQTYQDQQDAKSYSKKSAKEKKEYNLKKASDKAKEEQEKKKTKALEDLQKKQTVLSLIQSVAQIGMATATAIMKAVAMSPLTYGMPWSAVIGALGLAEIAAAGAAAAPAMATGGLVKSRIGGSQIVAGEAGYDEWVVPDTDKVMNGIASRLSSIQRKQDSETRAAVSESSGASLGERLIARVTAPFNVDGISFGNAIIDVFDKGYAHIGQNRVVPA